MTKGKLYGSRDSDHAIVHLGLNVSSSAHNCGCMVDGGNAMAAICVLLLVFFILLYIFFSNNLVFGSVVTSLGRSTIAFTWCRMLRLIG